jgi:hypothetical protein
LGSRIGGCAYRQGDERFFEIQADGFFIQDFRFETPYGIHDVVGKQFDFLRDPRQMLDGI